MDDDLFRMHGIENMRIVVLALGLLGLFVLSIIVIYWML
jgi:hypothetical protein